MRSRSRSRALRIRNVSCMHWHWRPARESGRQYVRSAPARRAALPCATIRRPSLRPGVAGRISTASWRGGAVGLRWHGHPGRRCSGPRRCADVATRLDATRRLGAALPAFASPRNPCDATAPATRHPESGFACAEALLSDPAYGALVLPWGRSQTPALLPQLEALGVRHSKPVCVVWMSQLLETKTTTGIERDPALALFR